MKTGRSLRIVAWSAILAIWPSIVSGQVRNEFESESMRALEKPDVTSLVPPQRVPLESTVDPKTYFVGPSDVFSLNVWTSPPLSLTLTVTPEGSLIIPTVGEVMISDLTLAAAKDVVIGKVKNTYAGAEDPSFTLLIPRPLIAIVTGNVLNPGSYVLAAYQRVHQAIEAANTPGPTQNMQQVTGITKNMSTRNIRVRHKDGTESHVDIPKFLATKEDRWNPHLREGDVIVVPRNDFSRWVVGVYGEVNTPGRFEYVRGDSVQDLINIAYGFTALARTDSVELTRLNNNGSMMSSRFFDASRLFRGEIEGEAIEPGDRVIVRGRKDLRADYIVTIEGEVGYPGTYPITKDSTRILEIIQKAGGFTEFASLRTAELIRQPLSETDRTDEEFDLERLESLRGGVSDDDSAYYYMETELRIRKEIVNVDFESLILKNDPNENVLLSNNDKIVIPSIKRTVYVFGQVVSVGHIEFVEGQDFEDYIAKAGGYTERARTGDVKIVKARTRQWLSPDETVMEGGDFIWVPKVIERPFGYYLSIVGQTASIISVALSVVILSIQLGK